MVRTTRQDGEAGFLERSLAYRITQTARVLRVHLVRFLREQELDLTPEQYFLLIRIGEHPGASQSELTNEAVPDHANVTRLLDALVSRRLVRREADPADRRRHLVALTDEGARAAARLRRSVEAERRRLFAGIDEESLATTSRVLDEIAERAT